MDSTYRDRGIIKWAPFDALVGYHSLLKELRYRMNRQQKPVLSDDQYQNLNQLLSVAINTACLVQISYFDDGYIQTVTGRVQKLDFIHHRIILEGRFMVGANDIIDIELLT